MSYAWPEEVAADIERLVVETSEWASFYADLAASPSFTSFVDVTPPSDTSAATIVRAKLGLPSNINNEENFCAGVAGA